MALGCVYRLGILIANLISGLKFNDIDGKSLCFDFFFISTIIQICKNRPNSGTALFLTTILAINGSNGTSLDIALAFARYAGALFTFEEVNFFLSFYFLYFFFLDMKGRFFLGQKLLGKVMLLQAYKLD